MRAVIVRAAATVAIVVETGARAVMAAVEIVVRVAKAAAAAVIVVRAVTAVAVIVVRVAKAAAIAVLVVRVAIGVRVAKAATPTAPPPNSPRRSCRGTTTEPETVRAELVEAPSF